jgi:hypothetical protein
MSPTVRQIGPYNFHFYSSDAGEPRHVHIYARGRKAKFWLEPVRLEWNDGFKPHELSQIEKHVRDHLELLIAAWNDFFEESDNE